MPLTLKQANTICDKALEHARAKNYAKLTIVVLDEAGDIKAAQREDGASMFRYDVALGKAWGAVAMSCSSRKLAERAKGNQNFFLGLAATAQGKFLAQQGAVLIRDAGGAILGAAGISGASGDEDEECAAKGVEAAGLKADI
jgi:uncharacterized protein GlcG (DUF336 family)